MGGTSQLGMGRVLETVSQRCSCITNQTRLPILHAFSKEWKAQQQELHLHRTPATPLACCIAHHCGQSPRPWQHAKPTCSAALNYM